MREGENKDSAWEGCPAGERGSWRRRLGVAETRRKKPERIMRKSQRSRQGLMVFRVVEGSGQIWTYLVTGLRKETIDFFSRCHFMG